MRSALWKPRCSRVCPQGLHARVVRRRHRPARGKPRILKQNGFVVYLQVTAEQAVERVGDMSTRPLFKDLETARQTIAGALAHVRRRVPACPSTQRASPSTLLRRKSRTSLRRKACCACDKSSGEHPRRGCVQRAHRRGRAGSLGQSMRSVPSLAGARQVLVITDANVGPLYSRGRRHRLPRWATVCPISAFPQVKRRNPSRCRRGVGGHGRVGA